MAFQYRQRSTAQWQARLVPDEDDGRAPSPPSHLNNYSRGWTPSNRANNGRRVAPRTMIARRRFRLVSATGASYCTVLPAVVLQLLPMHWKIASCGRSRLMEGSTRVLSHDTR